MTLTSGILMLVKYLKNLENGENATKAYLYTLQPPHNKEGTRKFLIFLDEFGTDLPCLEMPWKLLVIAKQFQSTFRSLLDCTHNVFNKKKGDFQEDLRCSRRLLYCKILYISRTLNFEFLANVFLSFPWQRGIFHPFKSFQCLVKSKPLGSLSTKGQTISE